MESDLTNEEDHEHEWETSHRPPMYKTPCQSVTRICKQTNWLFKDQFEQNISRREFTETWCLPDCPLLFADRWEFDLNNDRNPLVELTHTHCWFTEKENCSWKRLANYIKKRILPHYPHTIGEIELPDCEINLPVPTILRDTMQTRYQPGSLVKNPKLLLKFLKRGMYF